MKKKNNPDDLVTYKIKKVPQPNKEKIRDTRQSIKFFIFFGILVFLLLLGLKEAISLLTHINQSGIKYNTMCVDDPYCHKY